MKCYITAITNLDNLDISQFEFTTSKGRPVVAFLSDTNILRDSSDCSYNSYSKFVNFRYCDIDGSDQEQLTQEDIQDINLTNIGFSNISLNEDHSIDEKEKLIIITDIIFEETYETGDIAIKMENIDLLYKEFCDDHLIPLRDALLSGEDNTEIYKALHATGYDLLIYRCIECSKELYSYNPYIYTEINEDNGELINGETIPLEKIKIILVENHDNDCENSESNKFQKPQRNAPIDLTKF